MPRAVAERMAKILNIFSNHIRGGERGERERGRRRWSRREGVQVWRLAEITGGRVWRLAEITGERVRRVAEIMRGVVLACSAIQRWSAETGEAAQFLYHEERIMSSWIAITSSPCDEKWHCSLIFYNSELIITWDDISIWNEDIPQPCWVGGAMSTFCSKSPMTHNFQGVAPCNRKNTQFFFFFVYLVTPLQDTWVIESVPLLSLMKFTNSK